MQIVIDIPEYYYKAIKEIPVEQSTADMMIIRKGTPLPRGHGRLIDADDIDNHIIGHVDTRSCPTIIEADKTESEGKR
jgi:hypothetical protein